MDPNSNYPKLSHFRIYLVVTFIWRRKKSFNFTDIFQLVTYFIKLPSCFSLTFASLAHLLRHKCFQNHYQVILETYSMLKILTLYRVARKDLGNFRVFSNMLGFCFFFFIKGNRIPCQSVFFGILVQKMKTWD